MRKTKSPDPIGGGGGHNNISPKYQTKIVGIFSKLLHLLYLLLMTSEIVSEYDQEIPQSQTADNPMAPRGRATQSSRDTRKANQAKQPALSSPLR